MITSASTITKPKKAKPRNHNEWFRSVERGGRKSCPECHEKLEPGEGIWSWGQYRYAKFRHLRDVCKACWPQLRVLLTDHTAQCGCTVTIVCCHAKQPAWMTLEATCEHPAPAHHERRSGPVESPTHQAV